MSALRSFACPAAAAIYDAINASDKPDQLDTLARALWRGYGEGAIGEDDATFLSSCIDRRRPLGRTSPQGSPQARLPGRLGSRFKPRQAPRSPDRKASRERRRTLGGSAVLPPQLRWAYTEGQRSVLTIIAGEIKHHSVCDLPIDK